MHDTARIAGSLFFHKYWKNESGSILDVGAMDVNGTLRDHCPPGATYIGIDLAPGKGVDRVIDDPTALPFDDESFDMIVSSSCFEHDTMFWLTYLELCRVLKTGGALYISAPSNGKFHRYPLDCWRFYPDSAIALTQWAAKNGHPMKLLESFICGRMADHWNDCVMVFGKGDATQPQGLHQALPFPAWNIHGPQGIEVASPSEDSEDMMLLKQERRNSVQIAGSLQKILATVAASRAPADRKGVCAVCGNTTFVDHDILDPRLIADWQLDEAEAAYINRQQGTCCTRCGANLRSIVLARAITSFFGQTDSLLTSIVNGTAQGSLLEINAAGTLSPMLTRIRGHVSASYPAVDMMALPYPDNSFDVVVHSDTLEHVPDPIRALSECHRVLKHGGACIYTVPIVVGRLSRDRSGLPDSYHGLYEQRADDYVVRTEYGADAWTQATRAGFPRVSLDTLDYPTAIAITAWKESL